MKRALLLAAAILSCAAPAVAQTPADWRTPDPQNVLVIDTTKGRIVAELSPEIAPGHVERIRTLAGRGFYDGLTFFRVIDDFMAQTGDPTNTGAGASDLPDLQPEFSFRRGMDTPMTKVASLPADLEVRQATDVGFMGAMPVRSAPEMQMMVTADGKALAWGLFCPGVLGMARAQDPASANSQFFLMRQENRGLNLEYTPFGRVLSGLSAVRAIKTGEPVAEPQDRMTRVRLLADIPAAERPKVEVMDTRGAAFRAIAEQARAAGGNSFNICDIEIPAKVG